MKKWFNRLIVLLFAFIVCFSLTACGGGNTDESSSSKADSSLTSSVSSVTSSESSGENSSQTPQPNKLVCDGYERVEFEVTSDYRYVASIARNQPILEANIGYKCAKIPVSTGERYVLSLAIQSAKSYGIILTDENNFIKEQIFQGDNAYSEINQTQITIPENVSYIFVNTRIPKELTVQKLVKVEKDESEIAQLNGNIVLGCANCGKFSYTDGVTGVEDYVSQWGKMLKDQEYDLFSFEDVSNNFSTGITANSVITQDGKNIYSSGGYSNCLRISSKIEPETITIVPFKDRLSASSKATSRYYAIRLTYHVNGKSLAVYGLHFVAEGHISAEIEADGTSQSQKLRQVQFKGLINDASFYDESIFLGDFNAQTSKEYEVFRQAGYSLVNCGDYGQFATLRDIPADNIIVSKGFEINSIRLLSDFNLNTDHTALSANLSLK